MEFPSNVIITSTIYLLMFDFEFSFENDVLLQFSTWNMFIEIIVHAFYSKDSVQYEFETFFNPLICKM